MRNDVKEESTIIKNVNEFITFQYCILKLILLKWFVRNYFNYFK